MPRLKLSLQDRIRERSVISDFGCWEWSLRRDRDGYGQTKVHGLSKQAHRASYEAFIGIIPNGLTIDHLCRNPSCVNPAHLEAVTNKENILRSNGITAIEARLTHCRSGHEFNDKNTYIAPNGARHCRACNSVRTSKYKQKRGRS
jgi:hypothetical protein